MKTIRDIADLKNKKIILRVDFDVPISKKGKILEPFRILRQKETLNYLIDNGAQVVMVAHISAVQSFSDLMPQLHLLLEREINFIKSVDEIDEYLQNYAGPALVENVRSNPGEKNNDSEFAGRLARGFDIYINNAFAVCHREHASVSAITKVLPSYGGFLIQEEVSNLTKAMAAESAGKIIIMGGAKASTKVPVIKNLINSADAILLGGVVANDFLKAKGQDMGSSVVDEDLHLLLMNLDLNNPKLHVPEDFIVFDNKILDIGDQTMIAYMNIINKAETIIWNGPLGLFENRAFAKGTNEIANAVVSSKAFKIIGGGDTIAAVNALNLLDKFDFVSTGGGAMLSFLAGEELPGLKPIS